VRARPAHIQEKSSPDAEAQYCYFEKTHIVEAKGTHNKVDVRKANRCPYPISAPLSQEQRVEASPKLFQKRVTEDLADVANPWLKVSGT
jgi:hypothetical protein